MVEERGRIAGSEVELWRGAAIWPGAARYGGAGAAREGGAGAARY